MHQIGRVHVKCNKCMLVQHCGKQKKMFKRTLKTWFKNFKVQRVENINKVEKSHKTQKIFDIFLRK